MAFAPNKPVHMKSRRLGVAVATVCVTELPAAAPIRNRPSNPCESSISSPYGRRTDVYRLRWLKVVFAVLVAVDVSLVGWLAENYQGASRLLAVCAFVAVVFTTGVVVWVNRAAIRRFKALEDE